MNPVTWKVLADCGIAVRGAAPGTLGLAAEAETLRAWSLHNLDNLDGYWRPWAERILAGPTGQRWRQPRWPVRRGASSGHPVSKEAAGERAPDPYGDERPHPIIAEGLAYWRDRPATSAFADGRPRSRSRSSTCRTAELVLEAAGPGSAMGVRQWARRAVEVVRSAHDLPG